MICGTQNVKFHEFKPIMTERREGSITGDNRSYMSASDGSSNTPHKDL